MAEGVVGGLTFLIVSLYCWKRIPLRRSLRTIVTGLFGALCTWFMVYGVTSGWVADYNHESAPYWRSYLVICVLISVVIAELFRAEFAWSEKNNITDDRCTWRIPVAVLFEVFATGFGVFAAEGLLRIYF